MILSCPKCKKQFALSAQCFLADGRIDLWTHDMIACTQCGFLQPHAEFIGQIRYSELLEWVNAWNGSLIALKKMEQEQAEIPKSLWDIVVADKALRNILIAEKKLENTSSTPSLRFIVRSVGKPSRDFILGKFKEHLNGVYEHGYIDPFIQCTSMCVAPDGKFFNI